MPVLQSRRFYDFSPYYSLNSTQPQTATTYVPYKLITCTMPNFNTKYLYQYYSNKSGKYTNMTRLNLSLSDPYIVHTIFQLSRDRQTPPAPKFHHPFTSILPLKANPIGFAFHHHDTKDIPIDSLCCSKIGRAKGLVIISATLCLVGTYLKSNISSLSNSLT